MASLARRVITYGDIAQASILNSSEEEYDVFLNFRGEDTRRGIADHLYWSLKEAKVKVFKDDPSLSFGEEIEGKLLASIEQSKIAIIIISTDYASSDHCLRELVHILKCKEARGLKVMPIFYNVNLSDVRNLRNSFQRIQTHIIEHHGMEVESWKGALKRVGSMKGLVVNDMSYEGWTVKSIVETVKKELERPQKMNFSQRPEKKMYSDPLVGIDEKAREIIEAISEETNDVQIVGIYGVGGLGKTTLARYIYNRLLDRFEFCSFVANVRETLIGEVSIDQLLRDILGKGSSIINRSNKGMNEMEQFLNNKKVFIVLDDIDSGIEMTILMRMYNYLGSGSKIMLTTRNKRVLVAPKVRRIFKLQALNFDQATQLFCHHAFERRHPPDWLVGYTKEVVAMTAGHPLVVEVIGSSLFGKEVVAEWESTLKKLKQLPDDHVHDKLRLSYEGLDDNQKQVFLDIACLPIGIDKQISPDTEALDKLQALSLVKIGDDNKLQMHELLRDLGRKILQDRSIQDLRDSWLEEKRSKTEENKGSTPQTERIRTTANTKWKEPMAALEEPRMSQYEFNESLKENKLRRVPPEVPLQFSSTGDASMTGCNSMEAEISLSQPIAHLDRLFGEINSMLAHQEENHRYSTQEAISLVDSFTKQINLPDAVDVDFTSPSFLQSLKSLRQSNALEVPTELQMAFRSALTSFAGTPEYLDQIQSARNTFSKCTRVRMEKVDAIHNLKFKLDRNINALQKTQGEIAMLEATLTSLKAKERDQETELANAIPTVSALSDELKRCTDQLVEAQARFDNIPAFEEDIKTNHLRVLHLLHEIKNLLESKTRN